MLLREFWRLRTGVAISFALALAAAVVSTNHVSLLPPSLHSRAAEMAAASTQVLVDTPRSKVTNNLATTSDFASLTTRADLLGNIMASEPVRGYIAARAGITSQQIQAVAPITADVPRALVEPGSEKRASDLLRSMDQYRLDIEADPSVPIVNVYTQAPSTAKAERLANAAVAGLQTYLTDMSTLQGVQASSRIRIVQLGTARGGVLNKGANLQIALLAFIVVFSICCGLTLLISRVHRGWHFVADAEERQASGVGYATPLRGDGREAA